MYTKKYFQLIPEKVYQNLSLIEELISPEIKGYSADSLKEVISIVASHVRKEDGSAPLKMEYIKKLVPQGDKYLLKLIELTIIQRSGYAKKGQTSYKYNFYPEYHSCYISFLLNNAKLILRIEKAQEEFRKEAFKLSRGRSQQMKFLKLLTITDEYIEYIESNFRTEMNQYNSILASATRIRNGDIFYSIDNTSGRLHSNITNMSKGLRPFLRIKGEPLVNIDIKNSQPYLSLLLLTNPTKVSYLTKNPVFALLLQTLNVSLSQDVKLYINLVISGQIYEYLMVEFAKEGLILSRTETKRQVLRILFARNRMPKEEINRKARQIFIKSFPKVHRIFSKIRGREKGDRFQKFSRFAILLQSIESHLMLDIILKRVYKELPGTIAVTIHDSIMTGVLTNNVEAVCKIMVEELTHFVGFAPTIKREENIIEKKVGREENLNNHEERNYSLSNTMLQPLYLSINQ